MIALASTMPQLIRSKAALARALNRPTTTVLDWIKRPDFPAKKTPPWRAETVEKIARWAARTIDPYATGSYTTMRDDSPRDGAAESSNSEDPREALDREIRAMDPLKIARLRKLHKETTKLHHQIQILAENYVERGQARAEIAAVIHNTKTALLAEARASAASLDSMGLLANGAKRRVEALLVERIEAILRRFAEGMHEAINEDPPHET
ncbi:MAG: hypothetical protein SYC29_12470 [Planctomycetota bacterium]|nr:hypothetical protein [Planctomycetota bacterium]